MTTSNEWAFGLVLLVLMLIILVQQWLSYQDKREIKRLKHLFANLKDDKDNRCSPNNGTHSVQQGIPCTTNRKTHKCKQVRSDNIE